MYVLHRFKKTNIQAKNNICAFGKEYLVTSAVQLNLKIKTKNI